MGDETWSINPSIGCGPFQFGMSEADLSEIAGPFAEPPGVDGDKASGWFVDQCILSAEFERDALVCIQLDPLKLPSFKFEAVDLLTLPTLEVVAVLENANGGVRQAQGGSLYFEAIGLAVLQFETSQARSVMMWSRSYDHREPLANETLETVADYYHEQRSEVWPATDLFGEYQAPNAGD